MTSLFFDFEEHCSKWRQRSALIDGQERCGLTYGALSDRIRGFGLVMQEAGVRAGDRVTILSANAFQQAIAIVAGLCNGVIASPLSPGLPETRAAEFIRHANPAVILADDPGLVPAAVRNNQPVLAVRSKPRSGRGVLQNSEDVSKGGLLIFTSGTTGTAKGVLLSIGNIEANIRIAATMFGYAPGWVSACLLPLYHTFGIVSDLLPQLLAGGTSVVMPAFEMRNARCILERFLEYRVNSYSAPPVIMEAFLAMNCLANTQLRFAISGAAPLRERTRIEYERRFGHPIIPCYGLSEATCFATISPLHAIRGGSVGKPAGIDISVRDEHGRPVAAGQTGEIALRGPSVIRTGYYRDEKNAGSFTPDGYFLTGDLGSVDGDGYVYVTGRKKNMVIRGGEKVYLEDVDRSLAEFPGVADTASTVICSQDSWDRAISFVAPVRAASLTREALVAYIHSRLGPKHVPDAIVFTDQIPRTATGKPKHLELQTLYSDAGRT